MRRYTLLALCGALAAFSTAGPVRAGEDFTAGTPEYFFCKNFAFDHMEHEADAEGNKQNMTVFITGICTPRKEGYLPSAQWVHVMSEGHYDYATGHTTEKVIRTQDAWVVVQLSTNCTSNPWAHTPACSGPGQLSNNTGIDLKGPFPISAHMLPPQLRQTLAQWETSKTSEQMLTDWDPLGPAQEEELVIVKPTYAVPAGASFPVELNALHPQSSWMVQLEWARIDKAKDPSIEIGGSWKYDVPANAPTLVPWSQFPKQIPVPGSFTPGEYALRVRVQGHPDNTKSDWKRFWVGDAPTVDPTQALKAKVLLAGGKTQQYSLDQPGEGVLLGKGEARQFDFSKNPRFQGGQMKMMQGELPPGTGPKPPALPAENLGGLQAKPELRLQGPTLSVKTIAVAPVSPGGWVESGKNVRLSVEVANAGPGDALGTEPIQLQCSVVSGGQCPVPSSIQNVGKPIPAGSSRSFTLISATAAQPGMYEVKAFPTGGGRGSSLQVEIQVKGNQLSTDALGQKILMPGAKTAPGPVLPGATRGFNPQPEPPRVQPAGKPTLPGQAEGFSPKPEPPRAKPAGKPAVPGQAEGFNPQPEPPKIKKLPAVRTQQ